MLARESCSRSSQPGKQACSTGISNLSASAGLTSFPIALIDNMKIMGLSGYMSALPSSSTHSPGLAGSRADARGMLLGLAPLGGGSRLAIVGYVLPPAGRSVRLAGRPADGLVVDIAQHRALVNGRDAGLAFREFELLAYLAACPAQVFTRAHLLASVWGKAHEGRTRTVDIHVSRLRRKLGPQYSPRVVTVRRLGYMYRPPAS